MEGDDLVIRVNTHYVTIQRGRHLGSHIDSPRDITASESQKALKFAQSLLLKYLDY